MKKGKEMIKMEIEAKIKVDSLEKIKDMLLELGAKFIAELSITDYLLDDADATLTKQDKCLRIRHETQQDGPKKIYLTYKGDQQKSEFKKKQELQFEVEDSKAVQEMLAILGYRVALVIEKSRTVWQLNHCEIVLDKLPLLGTFVEIEAVDESLITAVKYLLGLSDAPHITKGYAELVRELE